MATSGPSKSLYRRRQDKFLRAALAGATFVKRGYFEDEAEKVRTRPGWVDQWFIALPEYRLTQLGYINGPYKWRHLAVDQALRLMELEEWEE